MPNETPELQALDNNLKKTSTIVGLQEGQEQIMSKIEEERAFNEDKFAQGAEKFEDLDHRMDEMSNQITKGFNSLDKKISEHIIASDQSEMKKLNKKLGFYDAVKTGVIVTLIGGILLYAAINVYENMNTPEPKIVYIEKKVK